MPLSSPKLSPRLLDQLHVLSRDGVQTNIPLAPYTSFRIGGPAEFLTVFNDPSKLENALDLLHRHSISFCLLGGGSNVLVSDAGIPGLTIINQCKTIKWQDIPEQEEGATSVEAAAGAPLAGLARAAIRRGLAGLSWAVSIPGTVGGAVVGNAGAHGGDIASIFVSARVWHQGQIHIWSAAEMSFTYRGSRLKKMSTAGDALPVILSVIFQLSPDTTGDAAILAESYLQHRRRTQPTEKSAGSIFKNPAGDYAGRLLDAAGLKGRCVGDACISVKHANFITNCGHATAADVIALMSLMRQEVWRQNGVLLEPEIRFIGNWRQGPALFEP